METPPEHGAWCAKGKTITQPESEDKESLARQSIEMAFYVPISPNSGLLCLSEDVVCFNDELFYRMGILKLLYHVTLSYSRP